MMKHDKNKPVYYRVQPINEDGSETVTPKDCATVLGCKQYLNSNGLKRGRINTVQKFDGRSEVVTGKAKVILNDLIIVAD